MIQLLINLRRKIREILFKMIALNENDVMEFERKFPNKCMICSFYRYGCELGYLESDEPEWHICKEAKDEQQ